MCLLRGYFVMTTVACEGLSNFTPFWKFGFYPTNVRNSAQCIPETCVGYLGRYIGTNLLYLNFFMYITQIIFQTLVLFRSRYHTYKVIMYLRLFQYLQGYTIIPQIYIIIQYTVQQNLLQITADGKILLHNIQTKITFVILIYIFVHYSRVHATACTRLRGVIKWQTKHSVQKPYRSCAFPPPQGRGGKYNVKCTLI